MFVNTHVAICHEGEKNYKGRSLGLQSFIIKTTCYLQKHAHLCHIGSFCFSPLKPISSSLYVSHTIFYISDHSTLCLSMSSTIHVSLLKIKSDSCCSTPAVTRVSSRWLHENWHGSLSGVLKCKISVFYYSCEHDDTENQKHSYLNFPLEYISQLCFKFLDL
jgi:hypothetical protein